MHRAWWFMYQNSACRLSTITLLLLYHCLYVNLKILIDMRTFFAIRNKWTFSHRIKEIPLLVGGPYSLSHDKVPVTECPLKPCVQSKTDKLLRMAKKIFMSIRIEKRHGILYLLLCVIRCYSHFKYITVACNIPSVIDSLYLILLNDALRDLTMTQDA